MPKGVPILILANKQDLPQASRPSEIADKLQLHSYRYRVAKEAFRYSHLNNRVYGIFGEGSQENSAFFLFLLMIGDHFPKIS